MRESSSQFLDNQLEIDCTRIFFFFFFSVSSVKFNDALNDNKNAG